MPAVVPRKKRRSYHHGDLRHSIMEASIALIAEEGAESFTLREVARRVGVTHAAAYRHFTDKRAVLEAIAAQGYTALAERLRASIVKVPAAQAERRLLRLAVAYVAFALEGEARFRTMTAPRRDEDATAELGAAMADALSVLVSVARAGVESGRLKRCPPIDHAMRVYLFAYGYASLVLIGRVRVRPARVESYFARLFAPLAKALRAG